MILNCKPGVRVPTLPGFSGKSHYLFNFINMKKFTLYSKDNHIHAVSDEPIGELQWYFDTVTSNIYRSSHRPVTMACFKKIEITTDTLENQIDCPDGIVGCEVLHLQIFLHLMRNFYLQLKVCLIFMENFLQCIF